MQDDGIPMPRFIANVNNITVTAGRSARLTCKVKDLGNYKVAWVRVDTQTILTIHHNIITRNQRISLSHHDHKIWRLHINNVQESDRGWYMCQINTYPMVSARGFLEVNGKVFSCSLICICSCSRTLLLSYLFGKKPHFNAVSFTFP